MSPSDVGAVLAVVDVDVAVAVVVSSTWDVATTGPRRVRCWRSFRRGTGLHEVTTSWSGHDCSTQRALNSFGVALDPTAMRVAGSSSDSKHRGSNAGMYCIIPWSAARDLLEDHRICSLGVGSFHESEGPGELL